MADLGDISTTNKCYVRCRLQLVPLRHQPALRLLRRPPALGLQVARFSNRRTLPHYVNPSYEQQANNPISSYCLISFSIRDFSSQSYEGQYSRLISSHLMSSHGHIKIFRLNLMDDSGLISSHLILSILIWHSTFPSHASCVKQVLSSHVPLWSHVPFVVPSRLVKISIFSFSCR